MAPRFPFAAALRRDAAYYALWAALSLCLLAAVAQQLALRASGIALGWPLAFTLLAAAAFAAGFLLSFGCPSAEQVRQQAARWRVAVPMLVVSLGVLLPFMALAVLYQGMFEFFRPRLQAVLLGTALASAAFVLGGVCRAWRRLENRTNVLLTCQWMAWPLVLPGLVFVGVVALGGHPRLAAAFAGSAWLPVVVTLVGALSVVRIWSYGLLSSAIGLVVYWATVTAWLVYFQLLTHFDWVLDLAP